MNCRETLCLIAVASTLLLAACESSDQPREQRHAFYSVPEQTQSGTGGGNGAFGTNPSNAMHGNPNAPQQQQ